MPRQRIYWVKALLLSQIKVSLMLESAASNQEVDACANWQW